MRIDCMPARRFEEDRLDLGTIRLAADEDAFSSQMYGNSRVFLKTGSAKIFELVTVTMRPVNCRLLTHIAGSAAGTCGG